MGSLARIEYAAAVRRKARQKGVEREGNRKDERAEGRRERDKNRVSRQSARLGQRNTVTGPGRKVNLPFLRGLTTPPPPPPPLADSSRSRKPRTIISNNAAKFITPTHRLSWNSSSFIPASFRLNRFRCHGRPKRFSVSNVTVRDLSSNVFIIAINYR